MRGGCAPSALPRAGAPREHGLAMLGAPGVFAELIAPAPTMRALRPAPRVTFSPMRKSPKNLPEGVSPSGYSPWGALSSPQQRKRCSPQQRKRCSPQKGEKLRAARKLHNPPAAPRIENRECSLDETKGKNKTDLPTNSKWQIGLFLWQKVARVQAQRSTKEGEGSAPRESRTVGSGAPLVTFPATGKSPGCRAERLHIRGGRGHRPCKIFPGWRGGAPSCKTRRSAL